MTEESGWFVKDDQASSLPAKNCIGCKFLSKITLGDLDPELDPLKENNLYSCEHPTIRQEPRTPGNNCESSTAFKIYLPNEK